MWIKMIRPTVVDGQRRAIGDVVETSERTGRALVQISKAVEVDAPEGGGPQESETGDPGPDDGEADSILRPGHVDDLTQIRGIGPRTAEDLAGMGIETFAQLAAADATLLAARLNGSSPAQVQRWIEAAALR